MDAISTLIEQTRGYFEHALSAEQPMQMATTGSIVLLLGLGISLFGAKCAHLLLTLGFIVAGAVAGHGFAEWADFQKGLCMLLGGVFLGIIGYQTFRLWVGALAAAVLAALALGAFGYVRVAPEINEFNAALENVRATAPAELTAAAAADDDAQPLPPHLWFREFWNYLQDQDPKAQDWGAAIGALAILVGMVLGLLALRPSLVISTSLVGMLLLFTGVAAILAAWWPAGYYFGVRQPAVSGAIFGALAVVSLVVQARMTSPDEATAGPDDGNGD